MVTSDFDKKVECGPEFVAVRILKNFDEMQMGGIYVPSITEENARLAFCRIEDCGAKAAEEYGIKTGDYAMIDRLSTFAHTAPVALLKYNNVICLTDESMSGFRPLRNMVFVEPAEKDGVANVGGIYVSHPDDKLNVGTITAMNCDVALNLPFAVGDSVLVTKGPDIVDMGDRTIYIYKHDMIICKILEA